MDSSVTSSSSSGYDADFGVGWKKLTNTSNMYAGCTTATLTIYPDAVDSYAVIKCCAKDTDSSSTTYNTKFYDVATFIDNSDPLQVVISSTGGDVFKNGVGSTTLTAGQEPTRGPSMTRTAPSIRPGERTVRRPARRSRFRRATLT